MAMTAAERTAQRLAWNKKHVRFVVRYQWRRPDGCIPGADPRKWQSWRCFGSVPILWHSREAAEAYIEYTAFKNMQHLRKPSCSVDRVVIGLKRDG
jgi:hypothetical protein